MLTGLYAAAVVFVVWRLYMRARRLVRQQRLSWLGQAVVAGLCVALLSALALLSINHPRSLAAVMAGTVAGALLGNLNMRFTRFERDAEGWLFTPNPYIGSLLILLLIGRFAYRTVLVEFTPEPSVMRIADLVRSPLTLAFFCCLAGFYGAYALALIRWRRANPIAGLPTGTPAS